METSTSSALSLPSLLRSRVGSVRGNLRPHRFVSVTSQVGGQSLGIGTCLHSRCQFCPLLARFLNLPVLGSAPETSSVVSGPQGCILWPYFPVRGECLPPLASQTTHRVSVTCGLRVCPSVLYVVLPVPVGSLWPTSCPFLCPQEWPGHSPSVTRWL